MSCRTLFFIIALSYTSDSVHAQLEEEFSDSFIEAQLQKAKAEPKNRIVFEVKQPIDSVFRALLSELPNYSDSVARLTFNNSKSLILDEISLGSRRISVMENGDLLIQKIIEFDPPNSFAYFTEMSASTVSAPLNYSIGYYRFTEQADGGTAVEVSAVWEASSRLTAFLVRLGFGRAFANDFSEAEKYLNSIEPR